MKKHILETWRLQIGARERLLLCTSALIGLFGPYLSLKKNKTQKREHGTTTLMPRQARETRRLERVSTTFGSLLKWFLGGADRRDTYWAVGPPSAHIVRS